MLPRRYEPRKRISIRRRRKFAYSRIVSPISGIVADRPLNVGEMANARLAVITVVDISRVVARVNVPQAEASAVRVGQTRSAHSAR